MSSPVAVLIQQAIDCFQKGNLPEAQQYLNKALAIDPKEFNALHILGVVFVHQRQHEKAQTFFRRAIDTNPDSGIAHFNLATSFSETGNDEAALPHHEKATTLSPGDPDTWINYGKSLAKLKRHEEALNCYQKALALNPRHPQALSNQGTLYAEQQRHEEALACFDKALALHPSMSSAWSNKANALCSLKRHEEALKFYDRAVQLNPNNADIWYSKGNALCALKRHEEALFAFDHALKHNPQHANAWHHKGNALNELKRPQEALIHYDQALALKPDHNYLHGDRLTTQMAICDWNGIEAQLTSIARRIESKHPAATPFDVLGVLDDPALQQKTAQLYALNFPSPLTLGGISRREPGEKIRVAYFSRDFHNHATAFLTAELFELHDRRQFEVIAFSFGPYSADRMRLRLLQAFDQFIDVRNKNDREIVELARSLKIDIAVDVQGYQTEHRTGIFAHRAAPIQVSYLAYPGTMGAPFMDYLVADKTLIPVENQRYFAENIVYLPDSYQPNDRQRAISDKHFTRAELGLPESGFVFCCFNNSYKILPETFDVWMRILEQVKDSVLWLLEGSNPLVAQNLKQTAAAKGIAPERLIFAAQMDLPDHLARHRTADLFLDTLPYNAHTTASDALWAGLPVLTCQGKSFASRVASSLLNAVNLSELITHTYAEYAQCAIDLASQAEKLQKMRQKLTEHRQTVPLFDTPAYVKHLEAAYHQMMARYRENLPLTHIEVG